MIFKHCVYLYFIGWTKIRVTSTPTRNKFWTHFFFFYVGEQFWKQVANLTNYSTWTKHYYRSCSLSRFFVNCRIVQCANRCNIISRFILWNLLPFITICKKVRKIEMKAWRELTSILIRRDSRRENRAILEIWHLWCKLNCIHPTLLYSSEKLKLFFLRENTLLTPQILWLCRLILHFR